MRPLKLLTTQPKVFLSAFPVHLAALLRNEALTVIHRQAVSFEGSDLSNLNHAKVWGLSKQPDFLLVSFAISQRIQLASLLESLIFHKSVEQDHLLQLIDYSDVRHLQACGHPTLLKVCQQLHRLTFHLLQAMLSSWTSMDASNHF